MSDMSLSRLAPEVRTLARPTSGPLLAARALIQRDADLQAAFVTAKAEGWPAQRLAKEMQPILEAKLEGTSESLHEAALYLADEYLQEGEGILLVSRQTGKVLARITEEDVWQPPPIKREDGTVAGPLPRLRPELEGFLVQWSFDREREREFVTGLTVQQAATSTAKALTHEGRKGIVERLRANADQLLGGVRGNAQAFLESFDVLEEGDQPPEWLTPLPRMTAFARTRMSVADFKATNLRFDVLTHQQSVIGALWVNEMAHALALAHPDPKPVPHLTPELMNEATFWVTQGESADLCMEAEWPFLAVEGTTTVGLCAPAGVLQVHADSYQVASREVLDRWEIAASVEFTLWVDWNRVIGLSLEEEAKPLTVLDSH